ncbi:MAG: histidine--tRNA ligase [Candidatus Micrarchaeota archaeon]
MPKYSTPRGTRDFLPEEMNRREKVMEIIRNVYRSYGYDALETPALEELGVLRAKCGEEVEKQLYEITGGKLGMRFDLTVPLARVIASNNSLPKPFKRYCISRVWRREEPQKGRFREFTQADIDVIGSSSPACEAELLACASECLRALGFKNFKILLNDRRILDSLLEKFSLTENKNGVTRALDKLGKISENDVLKEAEARGVPKAKMKQLLEFVTMKGTNVQKLESVKKTAPEAVDNMEKLLSLCSAYGLKETVELSFSLARGLDYYSSTIFEIKASPEIGSIAGGGRYDDLIESYGGAKTPAVGISFGVDRLMDVLTSIPKQKTFTLLYIATPKETSYNYAVSLAQFFRSNAIPTQLDLMERNLRKQFDFASSLAIPFVAIAGEKEEKEGKLTLRDMESGKEELLTKEDALKKLRMTE